MNQIPFVLEQHAEEAAFLWILRDGAVNSPHYSLADLAKLDLRVEAHLDGLRLAGPHGWMILKEALGLEEPGEVFAAAVIAFESGDLKRTDVALDAGTAEPELSRGLVSAIGWLPPKKADRLIKALLGSASKSRRRVGVAGGAIRRLDFEKGFFEAAGEEDPLLCARALRALAELGMKKHSGLFQRYLEAPQLATRFAAAWAGALLSGDPSSVTALRALAVGGGRRSREALVLAARRMAPLAARAWREELAGTPKSLREAVIASGAAGDPEAVPFLLQSMSQPPVARVAGEALSMITGVDLAYLDLEGKRPEGFKAGPNDDPQDENVEPDPDLDLPWPDLALVRTWWDKEKHKYAAGKRYLLGKEISENSCLEALKVGRQRQRQAAALELAILQPGKPLVEVRAPGFRQ